MKHLWAIALLALVLSCSSDTSNRNPYLQEVRFRFELNLNLPLYNNLQNIGNPVYVGNNGVGTRGAFVINTGSSFMAWEASCPNHVPNDGLSTKLLTPGLGLALVHNQVAKPQEASRSEV